MQRRTWAAAIVGAEVAVDQLTKLWAQRRLDGGRRIGVLPTLELDLTYNSGFSFGTGAGAGRLIGVLVIAISAWIVVVLRRETSARRTALFAVILGGALGNLADRIFRAEDGLLSGAVVDFIDVTWYAVFNMADMFVVCGGLAFALTEWTANRAAPATVSAPPSGVEASGVDRSGVDRSGIDDVQPDGHHIADDE